MVNNIDFFSDTKVLQKFKRVAINHGSNGNNTVVAAVAGKAIRVYQIFVMSTGTVTTTWQSGAGGTALSGAIPLVVNTGYAPPWCPPGHFETAVGALLNLSLSGAVPVHGWLVYAEIG